MKKKKSYIPELVVEWILFLGGFSVIAYKANIWVAVGAYLIASSCSLAYHRIKREQDERINSAGVQQEQKAP